VCPVWASATKGSIFIWRVKVPCSRGSCPEELASCKVVYREVCTEESRTAKPGTDKQELHMRPVGSDKAAHHVNVLNPFKGSLTQPVDVAGIGGKIMPLPGEICS
jgi:hypothetical protein